MAMRIYRERIPSVAQGIVDALMNEELIVVEPDLIDEVVLDCASVLQEYRRQDWEITEKARDLVSLRGLDYSHTHKIKGQIAAKKKFGIGDDAIEWLVQQTLEVLLQSKNVEEIFGEDHVLRRVITPVLRKELGVDDTLDHEVKRRIKNLQEGTTDYEVEYKKTMEKIRNAKGLND
jgi:hypothetical protein